METEPKRKRRWFQFSLRTLMIGVTLLSVPIAYVEHEARIVRERRIQITARSSPRILVYHGEQALPNGPNWFRLALGDGPIEWISPDHRYATAQICFAHCFLRL